MSFSTDGKLLATGCHDKNAYTWDIFAIIKDAGLINLLVSCLFFYLSTNWMHHVRMVKNHSLTYATRLYIHLILSNCMYSRLMLHHIQFRSLRMPVNYLKVFSQNHLLIPTYVICISLFPSWPLCSQPDITLPISPLVIPEDPCPTPLPTVSEDAQSEVQPSSPERVQPQLFNWLSCNIPATSTFLQWVWLPFFKRPQRVNNEVMELEECPPSIVEVPLGYSQPVSTSFPYQMFQLKYVT